MNNAADNKGDWHVGALSRLVWGSRNEDGERREVEIFFVCIEGPMGHRWLSKRTFDSMEQAERCVPAVERRLARGERPEDSAHWFSTHPVYLSPAYFDQ